MKFFGIPLYFEIGQVPRLFDASEVWQMPMSRHCFFWADCQFRFA